MSRDSSSKAGVILLDLSSSSVHQAELELGEMNVKTKPS